MTDAEHVVIPPPTPKLLDYPVGVGLGIGIIFTALLLIIIEKFDKTRGVLAISLMIVIGFMSVVTFSIFFTIPSDQTTSAVIGGLVAAFGAVIAHWIGRGGGGKNEGQ